METNAIFTKQNTVPLAALFTILAVFIWSAINPYDRFTWWLEVAPVIVALPILCLTYSKFRFTDMVYILIAVHAVILIVGGYYTYARVPLFDEIRDLMGRDRNSYDGLGHLAQGFVPAMIVRELLLRTSELRHKAWIFYIVIFACLGISATYEILEWGAAVFTGDNADDFLGTQGDVWDTQKDMALAGIGAMVAQWVLSRVQDEQIESLS